MAVDVLWKFFQDILKKERNSGSSISSFNCLVSCSANFVFQSLQKVLVSFVLCFSSHLINSFIYQYVETKYSIALG